MQMTGHGLMGVPKMDEEWLMINDDTWNIDVILM